MATIGTMSFGLGTDAVPTFTTTVATTLQHLHEWWTQTQKKKSPPSGVVELQAYSIPAVGKAGHLSQPCVVV